MASLNLSTNGPSIKRSYQAIVDAPVPQAPSSTYAHWALFSVQAPLASAFQQDSTKESVLKVQTTGEGELEELLDDLSDGRIQFAFAKVKDPNSGLPKCVLIAWCGEGVPERTKGYFGSHLGAVSKLLHGYHVQITARSDNDLNPESIIQKVADSSGAKYGGGSAAPGTGGGASRAPPPPAAKPVFMPTRTGGSTLPSRSRNAPTQSNDNDGWGEDAPQVTRSQLEKVESAYKPTKVNMAELTSQKQQPSRFEPPSKPDNNDSGDLVRGGYQPVGKVDINAIRRQAQEQGKAGDDRPAPVKGSYEPVGKVDIAAIRAKAQGGSSGPAPPVNQTPTGDDDQEVPKSLSDRSAAFSQSERLTSLPKPKVANRFGSSASTFTGTKAPAPGGFEAKPLATSAPIGAASKNFANQSGKSPAQLWAEKKARERGLSGAADTTPPSQSAASPIASQPSGGWSSGYGGKSWAPVQTTRTGTSNVSAQKTGQSDARAPSPEPEAAPPSGGVGAIRDRFKNAAPMGAANVADEAPSAPMPPPMDFSSKPNAGSRAVPPPPQDEEDERPEEEHVSLPPPPAMRRSPTPPSPPMPSSPIRVAMPVSRTAQPDEIEPAEDDFAPPPPMPTRSIAQAADASAAYDEPEPEHEDAYSGRATAEAAAASTFGAAAATADPGAGVSGKRALIQYDYEKAEDNEIELREGEYVDNIEMVDEDWWMGQNSQGESGLFPSNYVELVEDDEVSAPAGGASAPPPPPPAAAPAPSAPAGGPTATAQYDYEAAEDNELSFPDGATITNVEFPDEDWWFGEFNGQKGLFPANYVELNQ